MKTNGRLLTRCGLVMLAVFLMLPGPRAEGMHLTFAPGDLLLSFENGEVQWRHPDGSLNAVLVGLVSGPAEGMNFDAAGNLYVARWCTDWTFCAGNTIEKFNTHGVSQGTFGSGYCIPHVLVFDAAGSAYVGQVGCGGDVLEFSAAGDLVAAHAVATENSGSFWVDLAPDGCTLFYTSWGPNVKRFNVCTNTQLADFNRAPLPGGETQAIRLLPDGDVLVSSGAVIARLDASGTLVQTYGLPPGESQYWAGLDLLGDGTFWVVNYYASVLWHSATVYRFDLDTGAVRGSFSTGTLDRTVVDIRVSRGVAP